MPKKKKKGYGGRKFFGAFASVVFLILVGVLILTSNTAQSQVGGSRRSSTWQYGFALQTNAYTGASAFITHPNSNYLNVSTSESSIGNLPIAGVQETSVFDYSLDTFGDMWICGGDTDLAGGIILSQWDFILDSLNFKSTFGSGDTVIVNTYKVDASGDETQISGPDTLINGSASVQTVDYTGVAAATRAVNASAGEGIAIHLDEHGTIESAAVMLHRRSYYVAD